VRELVGRGLGLEAQAIDEAQPFSEVGLDSLLAVELRTLIARRLALERGLPATTLFDYPTVEALTDYLLADVLQLGDGAGRPVAASALATADHAWSTAALASMSEEDAEALLLKELDAGGSGEAR
jgi:acyl carrier protein